MSIVLQLNFRYLRFSVLRVTDIGYSAVSSHSRGENVIFFFFFLFSLGQARRPILASSRSFELLIVAILTVRG